MIYAGVALMALIIDDPNWALIVSSKKTFYIYWGLANGPLAGAVVLLKNALVLHDLENISFCFIHLTPPLVCWAMRWYVVKFQALWQMRIDFGIPNLEDEITFSDIYVPSAKFYAIWLSIYLVWMIFIARFLYAPNST